MASIGSSLTLTVILAAVLTADAQDIVVGFEQSAYNIAEGESLEICVTIISPDDIGSTTVFLEVVPDEDAAENEAENSATQDEIHPIFGNYLMEPGADYAQPLGGGAGQIFGIPLSQSQRSVCYNQRTYEDMEVEEDEYFSLRVATEDRTLSNVVINEALNTTLVRIIDDDMAVNCSTLANPMDGAVSMTEGVTGDTVTYTCDAGFKLNGDAMRICQSDGTWTGSVPMCDPVDCPTLDNPMGGAVSMTGGVFQDTVTYTCDTGFQLSGDSMRTCESNGQWSGSAPMCNRVPCPALANPMGGAVSMTEGVFGDTVTYTCDTGFKLNGDSMRTCQSNGTWTGSTPTCGQIMCPDLSPPTNGAVTVNSISVGAMANFSCNSGYFLVGEAVLTCGGDGTWSAEPPQCIENCATLPDPADGNVALTGSAGGDTATFSCDSGFILEGDEILTCQSNGTWDHTPPICVPLVYVVGFCDTSFDVTEGETIEICVDVISPPDIGDAEIYLEVLPSNDLPPGVTSATQDDIDPIFGTYLMVPGADYAQPLEGGAHQIFGMPLSQSQRSVCYEQQTYEDMEVEGDEYFSLRVATEARTLPYVVINEALNTTLVRIIDDDDDKGYRVQFNPSTYTVTEGADEFVELIIQIEKEHNEVLIVNISLIQQSAEAGSDYVATAMVEALGPGQREERVRVLIIDDSTAEETEIFTAILTTGDMDFPAVATVTILDDDGEEKASDSGAVASYTGIIIAVSAVAALLLIAAIIVITVLIMIFKHRRKRQKKFDLPSPEPIYDDLDGPYYSSILDKTNQIKTPDVLLVEPEVQLQTKENEAYGVPPVHLRKTVAVPIQQQENVAYGVLPNHQQSQSSGVESEEQL